MTAIYNSIGKAYDTTRSADPRVLKALLKHLACSKDQSVLDVGCGSGNYTIAIHDQGFNIQGLDVSEEMLSHARKKAPKIEWNVSDAHTLPFPKAVLNRVVSVLATHHMKNLDQVLGEIFRILKPGGRFVLFTSSPEQMQTWWLNHYVPGVVELTASSMLSFGQLALKLGRIGFKNVAREAYWVDKDTRDGFIQGGQWRPEQFLDPMVRAGISSFALYSDQEALARGLEKLKADIDSGEIEKVIGRHMAAYRKSGDYQFIWADR